MPARTRTSTKAAAAQRSSTNPRKVAAAAKARAALALKRAAEKSGPAARGGGTPQIGEGRAGSPPPHAGGENFSPGQAPAVPVKERTAEQHNRQFVKGSPEEQAEDAARLPPGAMSPHDAPGRPFEIPKQPEMVKQADGRWLVK